MVCEVWAGWELLPPGGAFCSSGDDSVSPCRADPGDWPGDWPGDVGTPACPFSCCSRWYHPRVYSYCLQLGRQPRSVTVRSAAQLDTQNMTSCNWCALLVTLIWFKVEWKRFYQVYFFCVILWRMDKYYL